jgi:mRNA degradation ribonuclease J1/J2
MTWMQSNWLQKDFADRIGFGTSINSVDPRPAILAKADVDPTTRGMIAVLSTGMLDGRGGADQIQLKYWYRRQNGQSHLVHLFEIETSVENGEVQVEEIYYKNKPLLGHLPPEQQVRPRELILDALREINLHLREGGSPKSILKILEAWNIPDVVGEDIVLPGQNAQGEFRFRFADTFNPVAQGELKILGDATLAKALIYGEVNTLDSHRRLDDGDRQAFASNRTTGATFRGVFSGRETKSLIEAKTTLKPMIVPQNDRAKEMSGFLSTTWRKNAANEDNFVLKAMKFLNTDISKLDTDLQIRVLGASYRVMDLFRRRRYPNALDLMHEFDLLDLFSPTEPPGPNGRFSVISYLGNGKEEIVEGFGFDLGACKAVCNEWMDGEKRKREIVILDLGKLLAPHGSEWDGGLPDVLGILKDTVAIYITHRHLDHMAALIELTRLGVLKGKTISGPPRVLYILENQIKAELADKSQMPNFEPIEGEGIKHYERLSVEYCVDGMDHSTPSTPYRVIGRTSSKTSDLKPEDVKGSYLFYGDGRQIQKPEFLSKGMRAFGIERQDTLHDLDLTNAKKPGYCPDETDAEKNLIDLMNCFPSNGILTSLISTNDRRLKTLYRVFNRIKRNFTAVGHNVEMSLRSHNIFGVDPEFDPADEKDNVNKFLQKDAAEETAERTADLRARLEIETDPAEIVRLNKEIEAVTLDPVEYKSRGSAKAKGWLKGCLGKLAVLITGTQGNPGEMYSTLSRFAEGWSTLDADRHTAYKVDDPRKWVVIIDQSAIPGNHDYQRRMIEKLMRNRGVSAVVVAVDDGFKVYGLNEQEKSDFIKQYVTGNRGHYLNTDGTLVITGAPIHPSGHAYKENIADIARTANADLNHGTHTNDPENTTAFHVDICEKNGLRHVGRQFDDFEHNEIDMGNSSEEAKVTSLGHEHSSIILFKIIREFGKFFGGTLRAKCVKKIDGNSGYAEHGIFSDGVTQQYEKNIVAIDFAAANRIRVVAPEDKTEPDPALMTLPQEERRYKEIEVPGGVRIDERKRAQILKFATRLLAA